MMEDEFNKPLIEHYQHDTDLGLTTAYSRYIEDLEKYYKSQLEALKKENEELKELNKSLIAFIEEESKPIYKEDSKQWDSWWRKVELLTQNDK